MSVLGLFVLRWIAQALRIASTSLLGEAPFPRCGARLRRAALPLDAEALSQSGGETLERELAVPPLAPLILRERADHGASARSQAPFLRVGQGRGRLDVEDGLDPSLRLLRVLAAGPARA